MRIELDLDPHQKLPELNGRFLPYAQAPVAVAGPGSYNLLKIMTFSLVPAWSKTQKVKFATYNARLDGVLTKPTWRTPFVKKHCLVPMTEFVESITELGKPLAGNMVRFHEKENHLLVADGIYDEWVHPDTGEIVESFAILTDAPPPFIADVGHDRAPLFLKPEAYSAWLRYKGDGPDALHLLRASRQELPFAVAIDRPLKPGWEKRQ